MNTFFTKILNRFGLFTKKQTLLSFEFGVLLSDVAQGQKMPLSKEKVQEAEDILIKELSIQNTDHFGYSMAFMILALLENKDQKE